MNSTTCKERKVTSEVPSVKSYLPEILIKTVAGSKWALFVNLRESYGIRNPLALVEGLPLVDRKIRNSLYQMDTIASVSRESAQVIGSFFGLWGGIYHEAWSHVSKFSFVSKYSIQTSICLLWVRITRRLRKIWSSLVKIQIITT